MKITGIITEYNPFHLGHEFHLASSKGLTNCDGVICVMSGNFVQRGLPALTDKWTRTSMALNAGVDLVVELPTIYAISSAEYFSYGAVSLLNQLNIVDNICFGSESGNINLIKTISKILVEEPPLFKALLKDELALGYPFAKARSNALLKYSNSLEELDTDLEDFLNSSNNILAIEYCKSLLKLNSTITPVTVKRAGSNYNDTNLPIHSFASASAIRNNIYASKSSEEYKKFMPDYALKILDNCSVSDLNKLFEYTKYKILADPNCLDEIPEASEGLNNKIISSLKSAESFHDFIMLSKSKRYSYTRINRVLCQCFLGVTKNHISLRKESPSYLRILGLNETGAKILKEIKKNSSINIVNKISKYNMNSMLDLDIKATNLYSLLNPQIKLNSDYTTSPIIFK